MSRVQEIKEQLRTLSPVELREVRAWLDKYEDQLLDTKFESEIAAGKWDESAEKALEDHKQGRSTPL